MILIGFEIQSRLISLISFLIPRGALLVVP